MRNDEDRRELPQRCEPAQPQDGIQPDVAARMAEIGGIDVGHSSKLSRAEERTTNCAKLTRRSGKNIRPHEHLVHGDRCLSMASPAMVVPVLAEH